MTNTLSLYPWESAELFQGEVEVRNLADDADYDAWLAEQLADVDLDPQAEPAYVPFQDVPEAWARGTLEDEPGYLESVAPYLY